MTDRVFGSERVLYSCRRGRCEARNLESACLWGLIGANLGTLGVQKGDASIRGQIAMLVIQEFLIGLFDVAAARRRREVEEP